nr:hypothetical protein [Tanacetum cinerariifolium]
MTRSSTKKLITPYEEPERELHSTRKLFKTISLDYLSLPKFDLFSVLKDQSEEEVTEATMEPTMEEYMTTTQEDYELSIARPKIDEKAHFELKGTQDQIMLRVFPMSLTVLEGLMLPQINSKESATNLKRLLKEKPRMGYQTEASINVHDSTIFEDSLPPKEKDPESFTIPCYINNVCFEKALADLGASESATNLKRLLKEKPRMGYQTEASMNVHDSAIFEDSLPPKEKDPESFTIPCYINNVCFKKTLADLGASGIAENVLVGIDKFVFTVDFIVLDMPEDIKVPLILGRPFFSTTHAKIDVFKKKIYLRLGDDKIVFKSGNPTINIIERVYTLGLRERMELDLEVRLMGEALILNRSLDHIYGDYIELNDLNEPLDLSRNQVEDLCLTIEEGEVIDEPMEDIVKTRNDDNEI